MTLVSAPSLPREADTGRAAPFGLSPMQAGMLFQALLSDTGPSRAGYDIEQLHLALAHDLDVALFERAWTHVARRHPALSVAFRWEGVARPEQRAQRRVQVPLERGDRNEPLTAFLERDRRRGFDLRQAPLMRVTVFPGGTTQTDVVWTFHHLLLDGRSFARVLQEVFQTYAALARGALPILPRPPRRFADHVHWLSRQDAASSLAYFRDLLRGLPHPTPLPLAESAAHPLPRQGGGERLHVVAPAVHAQARAWAHQTGTTLGSVVHAAWALVLARLTSSSDVLFGSTRACRRSGLDGDARDMIGLFINTLPMRVRVDEALSARAFLAAVRAQGVALRAHEHASLTDIRGQGEFPPGSPLFQTVLAFENRELNHVLRELDPAWLQRRCTLYERPSPPLTLTVTDDAQLVVRVLFDRSRFQDGAMDRLGQYLETAIAALSDGVDRPLSELDILPTEERQRLLVTWNDTDRPFPDTCIHEAFERRVDALGNATAVECDGSALTYAELEEHANRLAHALVARGAKPGTRVGICLDRGLPLVVAMLGVAKSGAAYVPLEPTYPPERLRLMEAVTQPVLVVTQGAHRGTFAGPTLSLDGREGADVDGGPSTRLPRTASPGDVCYVLFTSGSTGEPKGVVMTHRAVVNTLDWVNRSFEVVPGDRLLFVTAASFDLSVYDTFGILAAGGTIVVASAAVLADPPTLAAMLATERITVWDSAPAALARLVPFFPVASSATSLRRVLLSGDWIPLSLPGALAKAFPQAQVKSLGGATEAAIWSNAYAIGAVDARWASIPYGQPIQNVRYHVLDARMQPVAIGVPGELYIGGACLAQGYFRQEALTRERFVADPFRGPPERLYRTGDLARYFDDGTIEFLGRTDGQVKLRGFRVELGEVEAALGAQPEIREALCTALKDASGEKSLVAYVVFRDGASLSEAEIKARVGQRLPDHMVPSQVVPLREMPLTANGKRSRESLPAPRARSAATPFVAPRTRPERQMVALWEELLGKDQVGVTDNFFALGGHSLLAVMLATRAQTQLGLRLPLAHILEHPTIEGLLAAQPAPQAPGRHLVTLQRGGERPPWVLVAGIGGLGFVFQGLGQHLGPGQPLHVLNAVGAEDEAEGVDHSIEEMAALYEPQVLAACPDGPIIVGGYSFGALVAYELAHRLRRAGRFVPLLVVFDGFAPGFPRLAPLPSRLLAHARALWARPSEAGAYLQQRLRALAARVYVQLAPPENAGAPTAELAPQTALRLGRLARGLWRARGAYAPRHRDGADLLLVKTSMAEAWVGTRMEDPLYGWRAYVNGQLEVETVPGRHLALFDPSNQRTVAELVSRAIDRRLRADG